MKYKIYSASYKRAKNGVAVVHKLLPEITYIVTEDEKQDYKNIHDKVIALPNECYGKIDKNNYVLDINKKDNVILLDDDLTAIQVFNGTVQRKLNNEEIHDMLLRGFVLCNEWGLKMWGINCVSDKGSYREYTPFSTTAFIGGPFHAHIECSIRYDKKMGSKDDYDMNIQQANTNRGMLRLNMYSLICDIGGKPGGISSRRTVESELKMNRELMNKWGNKIVRYDNSNKSNKIKTYDINPIINVPINGI